MGEEIQKFFPGREITPEQKDLLTLKSAIKSFDMPLTQLCREKEIPYYLIRNIIKRQLALTPDKKRQIEAAFNMKF
jgi:hypothetical protein